MTSGPPCKPCCLGDCSRCVKAGRCPCERTGHDELVRGPVPAACGACATSGMTKPHCSSPRCSWLWCKACRLVTGLVAGSVRTMEPAGK